MYLILQCELSIQRIEEVKSEYKFVVIGTLIRMFDILRTCDESDTIQFSNFYCEKLAQTPIHLSIIIWQIENYI